jgi:protein TonB
MYADRYAKSGGFKPASAMAALAVNGAILTGLLLFTNPAIRARIEHHLTLVPIRADPIKPQPEPPKPQPRIDKPLPKQVIETVKPLVTVPKIDAIHVDPAPPFHFGATDGILGGTGTVETIKPLPPVIVQPAIKDMGSFQPLYPADERRAGNGGRVEVRVLVGIDGRVKDLQRVSATSDSFFEVTRRRALEKWRFTPATRDGIPFETWRTIGVSFILNEEDQ